MQMSGQLHAPATLLPRKEPLVPTDTEVGWENELVRTLQRREEPLASAGNSTELHCRLVTILTELISQLLSMVQKLISWMRN